VVFVGKRAFENGKWTKETEKGGISADIDSVLSNEQSQRTFVHNTSFMKDKLWSAKLNRKLMQLPQFFFDEKYF